MIYSEKYSFKNKWKEWLEITRNYYVNPNKYNPNDPIIRNDAKIYIDQQKAIDQATMKVDSPLEVTVFINKDIELKDSLTKSTTSEAMTLNMDALRSNPVKMYSENGAEYFGYLLDKVFITNPAVCISPRVLLENAAFRDGIIQGLLDSSMLTLHTYIMTAEQADVATAIASSLGYNTKVAYGPIDIMRPNMFTSETKTDVYDILVDKMPYCATFI